jgi:hypothetical protein
MNSAMNIRGCSQKFLDWVDNEIKNKSKNSLKSNTKGCGGKTHYIDSQSSDTTARSGRELYYLQFSLQAASPETFGYTLLQLSNSVRINEALTSTFRNEGAVL